MVGRESGLVARLKEDNQDMISYHCIIHQSVLCASLGDEYGEVMETIMELVNFLPSTKELQTFLEDQNIVKAKAFSEYLKDDKKIESVEFLADIMSHLNDLNVKLQGEKHTISNLISAIRAFQKKIKLFKDDIQSKLFHFPRLLEERKDERDTKYVQFIEKLINNFKVCFDDFVLGKQLLLFIQNPFLVIDITEFSVEPNLTWKWVDAARILLELIDFQENVALKQVFCDCTPETFWSKEGSPPNFPTLHRLAVQIITMFGSTYCCKSAFSTMNLVKNKFRSCMTNEHLHHCLRLAITPLVPKFRELAKSKKCNFSH
ncbi:SCAN domain-containing protein 3-like [Palaemon carinicauda]|uniref:SCAN domain-containing protein 3-like n=1 Tax=Palaemon carinicauda TaxID=392227 RepID=UPI0035B5FDAD